MVTTELGSRPDQFRKAVNRAQYLTELEFFVSFDVIRDREDVRFVYFRDAKVTDKNIGLKKLQHDL